MTFADLRCPYGHHQVERANEEAEKLRAEVKGLHEEVTNLVSIRLYP